jgi:regulator of protease activity HflC (stomatin/prohibitin superfamily)
MVGASALEDLLVADRVKIEHDIQGVLKTRLARCGIEVEVLRVRIVDAHPPREVVPAYRDVSAAVSDVEKLRNEAEAYASERSLSAQAEADSIRQAAEGKSHTLKARIKAESDAFLARESAHAAQPGLTEFRLLWTTLGSTLAERPKLILDSRAGGRRQVWLADPEKFGLGAISALANRPPEVYFEPED